MGRRAAAARGVVALRGAQHRASPRSARAAHDRRDPTRSADEAVGRGRRARARRRCARRRGADRGDTHLTPYQFPARTVPMAAGAAAGQFVVALAGSIEEWDPQSRMPKRRLKLPQPAVITALGGSDRVVWMTTQHDPTRHRCVPARQSRPAQGARAARADRARRVASAQRLASRASAPTPAGCTSSISTARAALRTIGPEGIDRVEAAGLVLGRMVGVLAAQARRPVVLIPLDGREHDVAVAMPATLPLPREQEADPVAKASSSLYDAEAIPTCRPR